MAWWMYESTIEEEDTWYEVLSKCYHKKVEKGKIEKSLEKLDGLEKICNT